MATVTFDGRSFMLDGTFDISKPEVLLYGGDGLDAPLVGVNYIVGGSQPPAGFTGDADILLEEALGKAAFKAREAMDRFKRGRHGDHPCDAVRRRGSYHRRAGGMAIAGYEQGRRG